MSAKPKHALRDATTGKFAKSPDLEKDRTSSESQKERSRPTSKPLQSEPRPKRDRSPSRGSSSSKATKEKKKTSSPPPPPPRPQHTDGLPPLLLPIDPEFSNQEDTSGRMNINPPVSTEGSSVSVSVAAQPSSNSDPPSVTASQAEILSDLRRIVEEYKEAKSSALPRQAAVLPGLPVGPLLARPPPIPSPAPFLPDDDARFCDHFADANSEFLSDNDDVGEEDDWDNDVPLHRVHAISRDTRSHLIRSPVRPSRDGPVRGPTSNHGGNSGSRLTIRSQGSSHPGIVTGCKSRTGMPVHPSGDWCHSAGDQGVAFDRTQRRSGTAGRERGRAQRRHVPTEPTRPSVSRSGAPATVTRYDSRGIYSGQVTSGGASPPRYRDSTEPGTGSRRGGSTRHRSREEQSGSLRQTGRSRAPHRTSRSRSRDRDISADGRLREQSRGPRSQQACRDQPTRADLADPRHRESRPPGRYNRGHRYGTTCYDDHAETQPRSRRSRDRPPERQPSEVDQAEWVSGSDYDSRESNREQRSQSPYFGRSDYEQSGSDSDRLRSRTPDYPRSLEASPDREVPPPLEDCAAAKFLRSADAVLETMSRCLPSDRQVIRQNQSERLLPSVANLLRASSSEASRLVGFDSALNPQLRRAEQALRSKAHTATLDVVEESGQEPGDATQWQSSSKQGSFVSANFKSKPLKLDVSSLPFQESSAMSATQERKLAGGGKRSATISMTPLSFRSMERDVSHAALELSSVYSMVETLATTLARPDHPEGFRVRDSDEIPHEQVGQLIYALSHQVMNLSSRLIHHRAQLAGLYRDHVLSTSCLGTREREIFRSLPLDKADLFGNVHVSALLRAKQEDNQARAFQTLASQAQPQKRPAASKTSRPAKRQKVDSGPPVSSQAQRQGKPRTPNRGGGRGGPAGKGRGRGGRGAPHSKAKASQPFP